MEWPWVDRESVSISMMMMVSEHLVKTIPVILISTFFSVVVVEFETGAYTVVEDDESLTVCVTKDRTTVFPIILLITPMESSPPSATGERERVST